MKHPTAALHVPAVGGTPVVYLAPILGVTGCIYRRVYAQFFGGYTCAVAPFISSVHAERIKPTYLREIDPGRGQGSIPLIPQILGNNAQDFLVLASAMAELGYQEVNWNLGCPLPKVRKKKRGSGLLAYPEHIVAFLEQLMPRLPVRLSLKVRLGGENTAELEKLLPLLNSFALAEIMIHPRSGKQMYSGSPDLDAFARCLALTHHRVVYSGDIVSASAFAALTSRFPSVTRWMIGRGGVIDPFLAETLIGANPCGEADRLARFCAFHDALFAAYQQELSGFSHVMARMKEAWFYWAQRFPEGREIYHTLTRIKKIDRYRHEVDAFFERNRRGVQRSV